MKNLPLILPIDPGSSVLDGIGQAVTFGTSTLLSAASRAADLVPLQAETLLRHLHRKLHELALARRRSGWFGGRWYNALLTPQMYHVELSGAQLRQVLALHDLVPPKGVVASQKYLLRADLARAAHDALGTQLGVSPDKLGRGLEPF